MGALAPQLSNSLRGTKALLIKFSHYTVTSAANNFFLVLESLNIKNVYCSNNAREIGFQKVTVQFLA